MLDTLQTSASVRKPDLTPSALPLNVIDLSLKREGEILLDAINLAFEDESTTIILGPNGAGKTLLLKICHGLLKPTAGTIRWSRHDCFTNPSAQAMVFQRPVVLRRSVSANIDYALSACGLSKTLRKPLIHEALELAGLSYLRNKSARVLSGGEQQRLSLARAWAIHPQVLFLDEPTSSLDPSAIRSIEHMIRVIRDSGTKVIMTTHDMGQAKRLAHEVVFMNRGRVLEVTPAKQFFNQPTTIEACSFLDGQLL